MRIYSVLIVIIRQIQQIRLLQHFSFYSRSLSGNIILGLDFKFTIFTNPVVQVKKVVLTHNIDTLSLPAILKSPTFYLSALTENF